MPPSERGPRAYQSPQHQFMLRQLCEAIDASGVTRTEIARRLNIHHSYISKILNANQNAGITEIRDICRAADINFVAFVAELDTALTEQESTPPSRKSPGKSVPVKKPIDRKTQREKAQK